MLFYLLVQSVPSGAEASWFVAALLGAISTLAGAIVIVYRGQIKALTDENRFLRGLLLANVDISKMTTRNSDRAITLAEIRAQLREGGMLDESPG